MDGKFGKALSFYGIDDYVITGSSISFGDNGSIMLWLNANRAPDDLAQICARAHSWRGLGMVREW